jgi:hypothetical protein
MSSRIPNWIRNQDETYGVSSIDELDPFAGARSISESSAVLSSIAIGKAVYGLQDLTGYTPKAPELSAALAAIVAGLDVFDAELGR